MLASLNDLAASAERYLIAHGKKFYSGFQASGGVSPQLNTVEATGEKSAAGESLGTVLTPLPRHEMDAPSTC